MHFNKVTIFLFVSLLFIMNGSTDSASLKQNAARVRTKSTASIPSTTSTTDTDDNDEDDEENNRLNDINQPEESKDDLNIEASLVSSTVPIKILNTTVEYITTRPTEQCVPPSINDFPTDIFTQTQRRYGGVIFHVLFAVYLFVAITKVCNEYFLSSLEIIAQKLNLDQDVAGATFMAAGSSAPEVFISLIGIFVSDSNTGIGAIVGSAVFNILFVIGVCGLFIANTAQLTVWPFFRDSCFYFISIIMLVLLIRDDKVYWYESLVLLTLYGVYIFFMMNNDRLKNWTHSKFQMFQQETKNILPEGTGPEHNKQYGVLGKRSQSGYNRFSDEDQMYSWGGTQDNISTNSAQPQSYQNQNPVKNSMGIDYNTLLNADAYVASNTRQIDFDTAVLHIMMDKRYFRPKTRFKMAARRVIDELHWIKKNSHTNNYENGLDLNNFDCNPLNLANYQIFLADKPNINEPFGKYNFFKWIAFIPIRVLFYFTIPDCRVQKYKHRYVASFIISTLWLAILSYLIVWMITVIGYTIGIPDSLMAVTFIAAGTSIPDAYTSIIVVKEGMVDMGVSNIVGSNVFDLLIGLAFPWFIKSIFNNGYVIINSNGIGYDAFLLIGCVIVTILVIHFRKWHLDRRSAYVFLSFYAAFLIFSASIEMNIFSNVNPPTCK